MEEGLLLKVRHFEYTKINPYKVSAIVLIVFAVGLRVVLVLLHWPATNSDEGTMATMAYNIAYRGELPLNFYMQDYMGPIEAYLGAGLFLLTGGPSLTALRCGVIFLIGLFFISTYIFTDLLFSKKMALMTIALLSVGSIPYLTRQIIATGGSSQTLLFGSLSFLIAFWLAFTYRRVLSMRARLLRLPLYAAFGLVVGLGVWSDLLVVPVAAMAMLLLIFFCWRELLCRGGWLCMLACSFLGFLPGLLYNISIGKDPFSTLIGLIHGTGSEVPTTFDTFWHNIVNTLQVSLPTATGFPFCPVIEYPFLGDNTERTVQCSVVQSAWSLGYLALLICSMLTVVWMLRHLKRNRKALSPTTFHQEFVRLITQGALLLASLGIIVVYIDSSGPVTQPGYHARYLIGILISTPVIIAPLWRATRAIETTNRWHYVRVYGSRTLLIGIVLILVFGTLNAFSEVPITQAQERQRMALVAEMEQLGVTRFYTDYWTCTDLIIASQRRLICVSIDRNLVAHDNRYALYETIVDKTENSSWMCPQHSAQTIWNYDCLPALDDMMKNEPPGKFRRYVIDGYVLYKSVQPQKPYPYVHLPTP